MSKYELDQINSCPQALRSIEKYLKAKGKELKIVRCPQNSGSEYEKARQVIRSLRPFRDVENVIVLSTTSMCALLDWTYYDVQLIFPNMSNYIAIMGEPEDKTRIKEILLG